MAERQWLHALGLSALLVAVGAAIRWDAVKTGDFLGLSSTAWLWLAVGTAVGHQVYVWLCWRAELHGSLLTRALGRRAFPAYRVGFVTLGLGRVTTAWATAVANTWTLGLDPLVSRVVAVAALFPAAYLFYSVWRYFGFERALGMDHFDSAYRALPLVHEGIFRWTPNAMYAFGFLLFWAIAFWYGSAAAVVVALFNHLYIWVHYFATEEPDMRRIYG